MLEVCSDRSITLASLPDKDQLPLDWNNSSTHHVRRRGFGCCHPAFILEFGCKSMVLIDLSTLFIPVLARYDGRSFSGY